MKIHDSQQNDILILELEGRLDTTTSDILEKRIVEGFELNVNKYLIDFKQLEYISSSGLRVLLMTAKKVLGLGGGLVLSNLSSHIKEVFDIAGFTPIFMLADNKDDGIKLL
ncbi:MAG: STAS domain-containing protein [Candidatus Marinimicrobia bacterium]|nr:STAS domain-containing protein [Candidatus Neomarinimicrobiota bacterium]